jgi:hypothetical protein
MKAALIVVLLALPVTLAHAAGASIPAYSALYVGTIGGHRVTVEIDRFADHLSGHYHYGNNGKHPIALNGTISGDTFDATETVGGKTTGLWHGTLTAGTIAGSWSSPDKKKTLPLRAASAPAGKAFPYDIRVVLADGVDPAKVIANQLKPDACDTDQKDMQITAIELVDPESGRLAQTLGQDVPDILSQGTCKLFMPILEDMNFDGWPDLRIARFLPAAPNVPYAAWLYDPASRKLVFNDDLSNIVEPSFDAKAKRVTSSARDSCCAYTTEVYAWQGRSLRLVERTRLEYMTEGAAAEKACWVEKRYRPAGGKMTLASTKKGCDMK